MRLLTSILLLLALTGCCTRIEPLIATTYPIKAGPHTVACRSNSGACYVMVDGVRIPMKHLGNGYWEADVFLRDGSTVWFEAIVPTEKRRINLVPRQVR